MTAFAAACGGSSTSHGTSETTQTGGGDTAEGGGAEGLAHAGSGGTVAGSSHGGSTTGGSAGHGGGAGAGQGGSGAGAGQGGDGGGAGQGGAGEGGGGGVGGDPPVCGATPPVFCGGGPITVAKACVPEALAKQGTMLPLSTCGTLCKGGFITFSCSVSAVDQTTITVQCATGCPATQ